MTGMEPDNGPEREILSRQEAEKLAGDHRTSGQPDPFPNVPPSLLSAEHIKDYVMKTGAIAPFYENGGRHSRLKMATYEGRIGECAFLYNKQDRLESIDFGEELTVKANSIVFVECDLDFRLPYYMALRFNLQIRHVHRGLLLGTGPLVDPGYWGKLCIPLHNLTDEDYSIQKEDGLIWIEFTKTTAGHQEGRPPLDLLEKKRGYWNIREFIEKASNPRSGIGESVPIRSSISGVIDQAEHAASSAKIAEKSATDAKDEASRMRSTITWGTGIAGLVLVVTIAAFIVAVYNSVAPRIDDLQDRFSYIESVSTDEELRDLPSVTKDLMREITTLRKKVEELEQVVTAGRNTIK